MSDDAETGLRLGLIAPSFEEGAPGGIVQGLMGFGQQPVGSRGEHHLQRPGLVTDHHHQIEKQKLQIGQGEVPASQLFPCVILAETGIQSIYRAAVRVMAGDRFYAAWRRGRG